MARAIERIEQDIAAIEAAVSLLAVELGSVYANYLIALGRAVRQQLIMASYHVCTQGYPELFLGLSFNQRQQLQQAISQLGERAAEQLVAKLHVNNTNHALAGSEEQDFSTSSPPVNPIALAQWQQNLEQAIANTLKTVSREANHLLQQAGILPKKLPPQLLEAAANSSEAAAEVTAGPPNLLNLLIESESNVASENSQDAENPTLAHILAIHLRLPEIEFADATVRTGRSQIRELELRARSLGREYYKQQRERAVAEAEGAWRASWSAEF